MPTPSDKLRLSSLCGMIFWCNSALGRGQGSTIPFSDIYREIEQATLFPFLEAELGAQPILSFLRLGVHEQADLFAQAMRSLSGYEGEEMKMLISPQTHSGLCLVIALCVELIQKGYWDIGSLGLYDTEGTK